MSGDRRLALSTAIGRTLGLLREARGKERREVAAAAGLSERELGAIEEGSGEASPVLVVELLAILQYGVEDLMLALLATTGKRRDSRPELGIRLQECAAFRQGNRDRPLSELLGVNSVEGMREGMTWSVARVLARLWRQVEAGG